MKYIAFTALLVVAFCLCIMTACQHEPKVQSASRASVNERQLETLLRTVAPWPGTDTNYSKQDWMSLIKIAKIIQSTPPVEVESALSKYQLKDSDNGNFQEFNHKQLLEDGKLFLLMRLIFDLPNSIHIEKKAHIVVFGGWTGRWRQPNGMMNPDGTVNLSWPILWQTGHPELVSGYIGCSGMNARCDAMSEYRYLINNYKMRDLSLLQDHN
jgi:hypothetical protein